MSAGWDYRTIASAGKRKGGNVPSSLPALVPFNQALALHEILHSLRHLGLADAGTAGFTLTAGLSDERLRSADLLRRRCRSIAMQNPIGIAEPPNRR